MMSDTSRPSLSSFNISTPVVDLSKGDATLRFTAGATDDISGVSDMLVGEAQVVSNLSL